MTKPPARRSSEAMPAPVVPLPAQRQPAPGPERRVVVANPNPGTVGRTFSKCFAEMRTYDMFWGHYHGHIDAIGGAAGVHRPRNEIVRRYLADMADDAHWLLFLDSDMVWPPDILVRLLAAAEASQGDVIGALTVMELGELGMVPNLFQFVGHGGVTKCQFDYPDDKIVQVAATGAACVMIHRSVLERIRDRQGHDFGWFRPSIVQSSDGWHELGEDIDFCLKAIDSGARIFVDTHVHVGHTKGGRTWWPVDARTPDPNAPIGVVIPMKDRADLTAALVEQLRAEAAQTSAPVRVWVVDNGSVEDASREWLASVGDDGLVTVLSMPDVGIHHMWNAGALAATGELGARARIAFLNNDIRLGPGALRALSRALADHPDFTVMGMNYDGRMPEDSPDGDVVEVQDICAGRYDGTGGLGGFAFAVRGEWITGGYRFPEECRWWFGDNDLVASALEADRRAREGKGFGRYRVGIALHSRVEHEGNATAGDWNSPQWRAITEADRQAFERIWRDRRLYELVEQAINAGEWATATALLAESSGDINAHLPTLYRAALDLKATRIVELGIRHGISTVAWLAAVEANDGHVWAVDIDHAPGHVRAAQRATAIRGRSDDPALRDAIVAAAGGDADVVFIDTNHDVDLTRAELALWAPVVRPGGLLVLHDVAVESFPHHEQQGLPEQPPYPVRTALQEFLEADNGWRVVVDSPDSNGLVIAERLAVAQEVAA